MQSGETQPWATEPQIQLPAAIPAPHVRGAVGRIRQEIGSFWLTLRECLLPSVADNNRSTSHDD